MRLLALPFSPFLSNDFDRDLDASLLEGGDADLLGDLVFSSCDDILLPGGDCELLRERPRDNDLSEAMTEVNLRPFYVMVLLVGVRKELGLDVEISLFVCDGQSSRI